MCQPPKGSVPSCGLCTCPNSGMPHSLVEVTRIVIKGVTWRVFACNGQNGKGCKATTQKRT